MKNRFMAKIIFTKSGKEVEVADGAGIRSACEEVGIMFGCNVGVCGTCTVFVQEGHKNLSERNDLEKDLLGDDENLRLACQCKIKKGEVKIDH
jgi:ferredoxin